MKTLNIEKTMYSPFINLDPSSGVFDFLGKSFPEDTYGFYEPIIEWIEQYFLTTKNVETTINFEITYFNSTSSKLYFDIFDFFEEMQEKKHDIIINWFYNEKNENALETGEDYKEDFSSLKFNLIKK